jgi:hypothetical protein
MIPAHQALCAPAAWPLCRRPFRPHQACAGASRCDRAGLARRHRLRRRLEDGLPALGWRHRRHYDMRATFIMLAIEDGADADVIETRITHTRKSRNAFAGYSRGLQ